MENYSYVRYPEGEAIMDLFQGFEAGTSAHKSHVLMLIHRGESE
jgi:hypothetical protein